MDVATAAGPFVWGHMRVDEILSFVQPGTWQAADALAHVLATCIAAAPGRELPLEALCPAAHLPEAELQRLLPGFDLLGFLGGRPRQFALAQRWDGNGLLVSLPCATGDTPSPFAAAGSMPQPGPGPLCPSMPQSALAQRWDGHGPLVSLTCAAAGSMPTPCAAAGIIPQSGPGPLCLSKGLPSRLGLPPLEFRFATPGSLVDDLDWLQVSYCSFL